MDNIIIKVINIVGNPICVDSEDGKKVFDAIKKAFDAEKKVQLSFENVELITSAFLNTAIGNFYSIKDNEFINKNLEFINVDPVDQLLINKVMTNANLQFNEPDRLKKMLEDILNEDDGDDDV